MPYVCQRCGACCRWPGQVRLSEQEISNLARFLNLSETEFIQQYTRLQANRKGLALMDQPGGECIFFQNGGCAVQAVKPQQCIDFPNKWNFEGFEKICQAKWVPEETEENPKSQPPSPANNQ